MTLDSQYFDKISLLSSQVIAISEKRFQYHGFESGRNRIQCSVFSFFLLCWITLSTERILSQPKYLPTFEVIAKRQIQDACNVQDRVVVKRCQYEQCKFQTIFPMLAVFLWRPHH
jgi:hypothetical protein